MMLATFLAMLVLQSLMAQPQMPPVLTPDPCEVLNAINSAQATQASKAPLIVRFVSVSKCGQISISAQARALLGGGTTNADFPASVIADNSGLCGATFVGPTALLTSAHCMRSGISMRIDLQDGYERNAHCTKYVADGMGDWAFCRLDSESRAYEGVAETLLSDPALVNLRSEVLLTGFGYGGPLQPARILRVGTAIVEVHHPPTSGVQTAGEVHVVEGDSGSSAFAVTGGRRLVVGVNWWQKKGATGSHSVISAISHEAFAKSLRDWLDHDGRGQAICGITHSVSRCR